MSRTSLQQFAQKNKFPGIWQRGIPRPCAHLCAHSQPVRFMLLAARPRHLRAQHSYIAINEIKKPNGRQVGSFFRFEPLSWREKPHVHNHVEWSLGLMNQHPPERGGSLCFGCLCVLLTTAGQLFARLGKIFNQLYDRKHVLAIHES